MTCTCLSETEFYHQPGIKLKFHDKFWNMYNKTNLSIYRNLSSLLYYLQNKVCLSFNDRQPPTLMKCVVA